MLIFGKISAVFLRYLEQRVEL